MEIFINRWPWYIAGPLLGLMVPLLLLIGNRPFGISASLRHICAACTPAGVDFFDYNWRDHLWNIIFVAGIVLGAVLALLYMNGDGFVPITSWMHAHLAEMGVTDFDGLLPTELYKLDSIKGWLFTAFGGFLIGFGTRWAGGCTSGHSIMGLSSLQWPSLVATICFMVGGFASTHFLVPLLLSL